MRRPTKETFNHVQKRRSLTSIFIKHLPEMILQVADVVAYEILKRDRLGLTDRLPGYLMQVVFGARLLQSLFRDARD